MVGQTDVRRKIVACSGGADMLHVGHVRYIQEAAQFGDVHFYLNTDEWLIRKKGYFLMPFKDRAEMIWSIKGVTLVIPADDEDGTVCQTIRAFKPDYFAKGGDRHLENTPEVGVCNELGIGLLFNIGGPKIESSSELAKKAAQFSKPIPVTQEWGK